MIERKPNYYWRTWENVEKELKLKFSNLIGDGICPTISMMEIAGISGQVKLKSLYGGIEGIAKKLNCTKLSYGYLSRDGHFLLSIYELILDEYLFSIGLDHEPNGLLVEGKKFRYDQKVGDIYFEIFGFGKREKGYSVTYQKKREKKEKIYLELNIYPVVIEEDFFSRLSEVEQKLDNLFLDLGFNINRIHDFNVSNIIDCHGVTEKYVLEQVDLFAKKLECFPKKQELIDAKMAWLYGLIKKNGGIDYFRNKLGYEKREQKMKWTFDKTMSNFKDLVDKLDRCPRSIDLSEALRSAITKFGGLNKFQILIGFPIALRKHKNYWTKETIRQELNIVVSKLGHFPTRLECPSNLLSAARKHGGLNKFNTA